MLTFVFKRFEFLSAVKKLSLIFALVMTGKTVNYSRRTFTIQCSQKQPFVVVVPFSADQSVFCDLKEFFQVCFQTCDLNIDAYHNVYYYEFVSIVCKICIYYLSLYYNISDALKIFIF